ncbi:hypothetical protein D1R32_gp217 [Tunisvirus fontaine2]|uniref:C2H2-type domain-containing protein n=1 Tax=Tunisvirus fontaine2 TaxID=1421067 RepID=V9SGB8_9VIRU|nr:hypothetical protein D1R32_gp217 [Tunisvirus fontaine2]AHC54934.1 hypothetical protein TNS_ORF216 [Tunisvirus fontaine2]
MSHNCSICQKSFSELGYLRKHEKTKKHLKALSLGGLRRGEYSCDVCSYSTDIASNFKIHEMTKKHKEKVNEQRREEEFFCEVCDVFSRDKRDHERHLLTKRHIRNFDASLDVPSEKLERVIFELVTHLTSNRTLFREIILQDERVISPKIFIPHLGNSERFLEWMRSLLEPIADRFTERDGCVSFVWPNHRYILSSRDFALLFVSLSRKVFCKSVEQTKLEVDRYKAEKCPKHMCFIPGCETCPKKTAFGVSEDILSHVLSEFETRERLITRATLEREKCLAYWKWWKESGKFKRLRDDILSGFVVEMAEFPMESISHEAMSEKDFVDVLANFSCVVHEKATTLKKRRDEFVLSFLGACKTMIEDKIDRRTDSTQKNSFHSVLLHKALFGQGEYISFAFWL